MKERIIYYVVTFLMAVSVIYIFWSIRQKNTNRGYKFRKKGYQTIKELVKFKGDEREYERLFKGAGIKITIHQYQVLRYFITALWLLMMLAVNKFSLDHFPNLQTIILAAAYVISTPKKEIFGKKTPFVFVMEMLTAEHRNSNNIEIYRAISQLKNMSKNRNEKAPGALFVYEQLRKFTKKTRPIFNRMIALYNENKKEEAVKYFENEIGTNEGTELANVLMKLDYLSPAELKTQLEVYQENVKNERKTARKKKNATRSDIIYFMVVMSLVIILANFVVVVLYLDSLSLMKFIF